jgi:SAM-dependent methyltransferase
MRTLKMVKERLSQPALPTDVLHSPAKENMMSDRFEPRRLWNHTHQTKPASERPEEDIVAFTEYLQPRLSPGAALLDVGCGRGRNTLYLSQLGFDVYACDLSSVALETAKARTQQAGISVNFQVGDLAHLPYASNLFEAIICVHVLPYHFKAGIIESVRELWRVLQPNGWLYLDLLACDDAQYGCGQRLEEHTFLDTDGIPIHFSSRQEVSELSNGFTLERVTRFELKTSSGHSRVGWTIWAMKCRD